MSTVALKGTLEYDDSKKEWSWKGKWAFGSSVDEATSKASSLPSTSRFLPPPATQPFQYHWKEAATPENVPVPSLNVLIIGGDDEGEEQQQTEPETPAADTTPKRDDPDASATFAEPAPSSSATTADKSKNEDVTMADAEKVATSTTATITDEKSVKDSDAVSSDDMNKSEPKAAAAGGESSKKDTQEEAAQNEVSTHSTSNSGPSDDKKDETRDVKMDDAVRSEETKPASGEGDVSAPKAAPNEKEAETTKKEESKDEVMKTATPKKDTSPPSPQTNKDQTTPANTAFSTPPSKAESKDPPSVQFSEPKPKPPPVTFASVMSTFTDAASKYKDKKCPTSGKWEGFFENVTGRNREKFQKVETQKVDETFQLFFNATPEADAMFAFEDASSSHIPNIVPESPTDPSLVQVRGCGTNQFGTFEIYGYLDLRSMVLEIQRQYVVTERRIRRRSRSTGAGGAARPFSTRKRQPSWKRKTYDPDEDTYGRKKRAKLADGRQKRQGEPGAASAESRMAIDAAALVSGVATLDNAVSAPLSIGTTAGPLAEALAAAAQGATKSGFLSNASLKISVPTQGGALARPPSGTRRRGGGGGGVRSRRGSSKIGAGAAGNASSTSPGSSPYIRLPTAGDPKKARWRASHFLYYQRHEPEQQQATDSSGISSKPNSPKVAPKPKYVIYEGELVDNKREGRGICLYSNSTLYEGEWKKDKEHGYGKLMSSDRRQTIYEGEWERGKMQGSGTYYYGSSDPENPGSRYVGEFKENLRNGMGRYFLDGGEIYDGQWRDGVMNGHGVFTWPDSSIYDGEWKGGKRNGQGLLKTADGFIYDGQWVNNAMEGRGLAIYPSGQRYEGSWNNGRREGRGTMHFTEGAVYEGRFRDDAIDGQGTMKMQRVIVVSGNETAKEVSADNDNGETPTSDEKHNDFMIPISFQSDLTAIHNKAGFTAHGE